MANPNPEIWGAPDTWLNAKGYWQGGRDSDNPDIKAERAKIANFGGNDDEYVGSLGRAYDNNIIELAPLDNSIVSCGQNPAASAYGTIKLFTNKQSAELNIIPDKVITQTQPVNWFFYYMSGFNYYSTNTMTRYGRVDFNNAKMRMYPDAEAGTKPLNYNPNLLITPIVHYQIRSIWCVIWVQIDNDTYGGGAWYTLEDWKNNYSSQPIRNINMDIFGYSSDNGTNVTYSRSANLDDGEANNAAFMGSIDGINCYTAFTFERAPVITLANSIDYNYYNDDFTFCAVGWRDDWENSTIKSYVQQSTEHGWCVWQSVPYTVANYEKIMQMAACFGVPFSDSNHNSIPIDFNANYVCLPVIDENGIATGEYTRGADNLTNPFVQLDSVRDTNYDPSKQYDPNTYSNITGWNSIGPGATLTKRYVLDKTNVQMLGDDLWSVCDTIANGDYEHFDGKLKDAFLTTNPIDSVVSLIRLPFDIPHTGATTKQAVKLGKYDGEAEGYVTFNVFNTIQFKGINIWPRFGNCFLDYEPYTQYEVYVPFCGTTKLSAADILGHVLNIFMQIDLITGSCTAYIMADELCIETLNGSCGVELTLSGTDSATVNANIFNGILNQKSAEASDVATIGSMIWPTGWVKGILDPAGTANKIYQADTAEQQASYAITHMQAPTHKIGAASPLLSWVQEFDARLIIYYPEGEVIISEQPPKFNKEQLASFGHLKGFGTVSPGIVSSYRGADGTKSYLIKGEIKTDGIPCTDNERRRLISMFLEGVYI